MSCNKCNKSNCNCKRGNVCDPSFTGDISYDGEDFTCSEDPTLDTPSNTRLNVILVNILSHLCALAGINIQNVGGGAEMFRDQIGWTFNFRTIVGGPGIDIVQNADTIEIQNSNIGTYVARTVFCSSEALGGGEGGTSLPGVALTGTTYVVPPGFGGTFDIYYTVDARIVENEFVELRADVNNVEIDPDAKRKLSTTIGQQQFNTTLLLCDVPMIDGDTFNIKGYVQSVASLFGNGVLIIKKVS